MPKVEIGQKYIRPSDGRLFVVRYALDCGMWHLTSAFAVRLRPVFSNRTEHEVVEIHTERLSTWERCSFKKPVSA